LTYQWAKGGTLPANYIAGATLTAYTRTNLQTADGDNYYVLIGDTNRPAYAPLVVSTAANLAVIERFGAAAIDYRAGDFVTAVRQLTPDGAGVDIKRQHLSTREFQEYPDVARRESCPPACKAVHSEHREREVCRGLYLAKKQAVFGILRQSKVEDQCFS
jgi:hypothetical protein